MFDCRWCYSCCCVDDCVVPSACPPGDDVAPPADIVDDCTHDYDQTTIVDIVVVVFACVVLVGVVVDCDALVDVNCVGV